MAHEIYPLPAPFRQDEFQRCAREDAELGLGGPGAKQSRSRRRGLPHFDAKHAYQFVTFRLADSLPREVLVALEREMAALSAGRRDAERRIRVEAWLDAGRGRCTLQRPAMARVMRDTLERFDGERYRLIAWCIMPNHVHVLIETLMPLPRIVQSWKAFTGRWAVAHWAELGLGLPGRKPRAFWMRDYWDRCVRNERHFRDVVTYIHGNPVKAGLCAHADDWPWSSARHE